MRMLDKLKEELAKGETTTIETGQALSLLYPTPTSQRSPFLRKKPTGQSTGLGLSLAYDIVKAHCGEIKMETKEGKGSNFSMILTGEILQIGGKLGFIFFWLLSFSQSIAQGNSAAERQTIKEKIVGEKNDSVKVDLLNGLGFAYTFVYADSATETAYQALEISRSSNYKKGEIQSLGILSVSLTILGNFPTALKYSFEALTLSEKLGDPNLIIESLSNLMTCYRDQEDYKEALKYGFKGLQYTEMPKVGKYQKFLLLGFISSVYEKNNQLDSALYFGAKAEDLNSFPWAGLYLTLGNVYSKMNKNEMADIYYRKGISIAEKGIIYIDLVDIYNKLSIMKENAGYRDSSFYYAKKSMETEGFHNYPEGELRAALQLAHLYESSSEKDSTIKYLKLSSDLRNSLFSRQKTREAHSLAFNNQLMEQERATEKRISRNKIRVYVLAGIIFLFLIAAFLLWRNNRHKQKANLLLHKQKREIQNTLSQLRATQSQLIQSEKLASLGELTAGIAHEIQNPLNFVNNFAEVSAEMLGELKEELQKGETTEAQAIAEDLKVNLEKINHHGKRASGIVKSMLEHSRTSTGIKEPTDLNALADEYLRLAYHGLRAKDSNFSAAYELIADPNLPKIDVVPQDMGRVLLNLINNAFYAVNEKAKMGIAGYQPAVTVRTSRLEHAIEIRVEDNGSGIPEAIKDKIFQPFFTTKPTGQGTGLGLSLAYDIVTKGHGGKVEVASEDNLGTSFYIYLPFSQT